MLIDIADIRPTRIWNDILARIVHGDRISLAIVELPPGSLVPEHRHDNEQVGLCLQGTVTFRIGDDKRELGPGGIWCIPSQAPHEALAGPAGAVVVEVFAPPRDDWKELPETSSGTAKWPAGT